MSKPLTWPQRLARAKRRGKFVGTDYSEARQMAEMWGLIRTEIFYNRIANATCLYAQLARRMGRGKA